MKTLVVVPILLALLALPGLGLAQNAPERFSVDLELSGTTPGNYFSTTATNAGAFPARFISGRSGPVGLNAVRISDTAQQGYSHLRITLVGQPTFETCNPSFPTLGSCDDVYDDFIFRLSHSNGVIHQGAMTKFAGTDDELLRLYIPEAKMPSLVLGQRFTLVIQRDRLKQKVAAGPGGLVFAQIVLAVVGTVLGLRMGPVGSVAGALFGAYLLPVFGMGGPEMWFLGTIIVLLSVAGAFGWRLVLARR